MGRHIQSGTKMDARDVSSTNENLILEQDPAVTGLEQQQQQQQQNQLTNVIALREGQNSEGRSTNLEISLSELEPVQQAPADAHAFAEPVGEELKLERDEIEAVAAASSSHPLIVWVIDANEGPAILSPPEVAAAAGGDLSLAMPSLVSEESPTAAQSRFPSASVVYGGDEAAAPSTAGDVKVEAKARDDEQLRVSANNKRLADNAAASPMRWDAAGLADPRETKVRSVDAMNRNRMGANFSSSRWDRSSCESRAQGPSSARCSQGDPEIDSVMSDAASSMQIDAVRISPSRESSPEPTVVDLEERQEWLRKQSIEMRFKPGRSRPQGPPLRPINNMPTVPHNECQDWFSQVERKNNDKRNSPEAPSLSERYNCDIHRETPLKRGRWKKSLQQP